MWKWIIAALLLTTATSSFGRDLQKEITRADEFITSICAVEGREKDYDCALGYIVLAQIMACLTLYQTDDGARLECFDDRVGTMHNAYRKVLRYQ